MRDIYWCAFSENCFECSSISSMRKKSNLAKTKTKNVRARLESDLMHFRYAKWFTMFVIGHCWEAQDVSLCTNRRSNYDNFVSPSLSILKIDRQFSPLFISRSTARRGYVSWVAEVKKTSLISAIIRKYNSSCDDVFSDVNVAGLKAAEPRDAHNGRRLIYARDIFA